MEQLHTDSLWYEDHLRIAKTLYIQPAFCKGKAKSEAIDSHAWAVFSPLRDLAARGLSISEKLSSPHAISYMKFGVIRRTKAIWYAYRDIIDIARIDRIEPLNRDDELDAVNRGINLIYLHLKGTLDNLAWCLVHENHACFALEKNKNKIDLFHKDFPKEAFKSEDLSKEIEKHKQWWDDAKGRRDPAAHRIPLYIVPTFLSDNDQERLQNQFYQNIKTDRADEFFHKTEAIGTFYPCIMLRDKTEEFIDLYPTLPEDMAHLIEIFSLCEKALVQD